MILGLSNLAGRGLRLHILSQERTAMSTIADNFIKDGSFGRRLLAMLASFYAIALIWGQKAGEARTSDTR